MNKLIEFFNEYKAITDSYEGPGTDWEFKWKQLYSLVWRIREYKVRGRRNERFCSWVRTNLLLTVEAERVRIGKQIAKEEKRG